MKVYFIRHGQSLDDVFNEYGSWSERELSPSGIKTAFKLADKLKKLQDKYDAILTSPLKRALQTSEVVASELDLKVVEEPYLKERNTYGLLSGVNKDIAIEEYPEMNAAFLEGRYLPASERYKDFIERLRVFFKKLETLNYKNVICSTHGHVITVIIEEFFGLVRNSVDQGCILGIEISKTGKKIIHADGITFTKSEDVIRGVAFRKFKKE